MACLLIIAVPGGAQCSQGSGEQAATAVRLRQSELLALRTDELPTAVPLVARAQIVALKDALASSVEAELRCATANEPAAALQSRLEKRLAANHPQKRVPEPSDKMVTGLYGADLQVIVTAPVNAPQLRVIVASFGIECGTDAMLLVYEPAATGWRQTLRWQSPKYADISGAFGGFFQYALMPGSPWKIAVAHGTDWCTSRWSGFDIDVLAAAANAAAPRVIWHQRHDYVIESDPRMVARPDGFELRLDVGTIETEQLTRKGIFRYRVSDDTVERVQPIALDGRGFVDAWLQAPWGDAMRWSVAEGAAGFAAAHEAFARGHKDASVAYSYGPVRACLAKGRYEVEMDAEPGGAQFYAIQEGPVGYTTVNFGTTQDERCTGLDLMRKP